MAEHFLATALGCARRALARPGDPAADAQLLDRFVRDRDEAAFAELVARHGPVVWAACRRGTASAADAEDVFQATFLVLARRAARVRRAAAVGGWLFRVAVRLAARTRARAVRSAGPPRPDFDPAPGPADRAAWKDVVAVLDEELAALPEAVRAALVCCYYESLTQDEAARRLGWKVRTVRARVSRGRTVLRARLARRGVELGAALAAAAIGAKAGGGLPMVGSVLPSNGSVAMSPAVAALVRDGLALTGRAVSLPVAIGAAVLLIAGFGYALGVGFGPPPVGSPVAVAPPDVVPEAPADPKLAVDAVAIYNRAVDGCVYIFSETDGAPIEGTGALIDKESRLVLTTCRVVGDSDVVPVQFPYHNLDGTIDTDRKDYARSAAAKLTPRGRVIRRDPARDLALVQVDRLGRDARPLELAETVFGEKVLHIGSGTGKLFPMTVRKVLQVDAGAVNVPVSVTAEQVKAQTITLSGPTDDSGGPLIDREGRLAGLVERASKGPEDQNVTLAITIAEIRAFLAEKDKKIPDPPAAPKTAELPPRPQFFGPPGAVRAPSGRDEEFNGAELYERCVRSSVFIVVPTKGGHSEGSGSLIDTEQRLVITCAHVVGDVDIVFCQFPGYNKDGSLITDKKKYIERIPAGQAIKGKVLYRDNSRDLALILLEKLPPNIPAIPLAKKSIRVGEKAINIGNPGKVDSTFSTTEGTVRAVDVRDFIVGGSDGVVRIKAKMVTATNPISTGDSGGPLIDKRGYLVGVSESGIFDGRTQNVNGFVDVTEVWAFLAEKKIAIKELSTEPDKPEIAAKIGPTKQTTPAKSDTPPGVTTPAKNGDTPPAATGPTAEDEKKASELLQKAKLFKEDDKDYFAGKLKDLIRKYPGTAAAKEAQKLLDVLK